MVNLNKVVLSKINNENLSNLQYNDIDWKEYTEFILEIQDKITKSAQINPFSKRTLELQKTLLRSQQARAIAFRNVITNDGGKTPGDDGIILKKSDFPSVMPKLENFRNYKCGKVKRVWIPKNGSNKLRPLGIPNSIDRVWQALFSLALEPVVFTMNCPRSYGYIRHRSCRDAVAYLKGCLNLTRGDKNISAPLVIEADIKGFFDNIDHNWLMDHTPIPYKHFLREWLKAKVIDNDKETFPGSGTPQGGIISPLLANITLAGLESHIKTALPKTRRVGKNKRILRKVNVVRYADDFVVTCSSKSDANTIIKSINSFLEPRGLTLNKDKTKITDVVNGFDFLGFNLKQFSNGLLVTPSLTARKALRAKVKWIMKKRLNSSSSVLIKQLNPVLTGWANYFRISSTTKIFTKEGHFLWFACMKWLTKKYPRTGKRKLYKDHFCEVKTKTGSMLIFCAKSLDDRIENVKVSLTNIAMLNVIPTRYNLLKIDKNPYLLQDKEYFDNMRIKRARDYMSFSTIWSKLNQKQKGRCAVCSEILEFSDRLEVDHIIPLSKGGKDTIKNKRLLHFDCHRLKRLRDGKL
jgi:RNA-directed DNA polymerase